MDKTIIANPIYPCLWFDGNAGAAATFYCSVFKNSKIKTDTSLVTIFELNGKKIMGLNGGPMFRINPSISFFVECESIAETNGIWDKLINGGKALMAIDKYPWSERYGWLQDKFGVTWQIMMPAMAINDLKISLSFLFANNQFGRAEEAIRFYTGVFDHSSPDFLAHYPADNENAGKIMFSRFNLMQCDMTAMDGPGNYEGFNEAVSLVVDCASQKEIDYYWDKLLEGGQESQCGWLKDKFGVSWQIIPAILQELMANPAKSQRVMKVLMQMKKLDIEKLSQA